MYPVKPKAGSSRPLITTPFGKPGPWIAGHHTGTDFGWTRAVEFVRATYGGRVIHVGRRDRFYGNYVVVQHPNGRQSWYCHLAVVRPTLRPGVKIHTGRLLGIMGATGNATGRHLHYEERVAPYGYMDHREPQLLHEKRPARLKGWAA